jgi:D-tyrosyl-tRNA(Tyr) deacylase
MRALIQRVTQATVTVDQRTVGTCKRGFLVLLGVGPNDSETDAQWLAKKIASLRVFPDDDGKMNRSIADISGSCLVISQFTLYGDCRKGRRPSFVEAAHPDLAKPLYEHFVELLSQQGIPVETGIFAADMQVSLTNDGPVTLMIDTPTTSKVEST